MKQHLIVMVIGLVAVGGLGGCGNAQGAAGEDDSGQEADTDAAILSPDVPDGANDASDAVSTPDLVGAEAGSDTASDLVADLTGEIGEDAIADAATDAAMDAEVDDAGAPDSDVTADVAPDAVADGGTDAGVEVAADVESDAADELTLDADADVQSDGQVDTGPDTAGPDSAADAADADDGSAECAADEDCATLHGAAPTCQKWHCGAGVCALELDGGPCDDANACTNGDSCTASGCIGAPTICDDNNPCTFETCEPTTGCGSSGNATLGTVCTLTVGGSGLCDSGVCATCLAGTNDGCLPSTPCATIACVAGACQTTPLTGTACEDGNPCSSGDSCVAGACTTGAQMAATCDDGDSCTLGDHCTSTTGACVATETLPCSDDDPCTSDSCATGACTHTLASGLVCDDGDACTTGETCSASGCGSGSPTSCEDGNPCTVDTCQPQTGCAHAANPCDDFNACTDDSCVPATGCAHATKSCNADNNACTLEICDTATGCAANGHATAGTPCTKLAGGGGYCDAGFCSNCVGGSNLGCAASTTCATVACVANTSGPGGYCKSTPLTAWCDDGNPCSSGDICAAGTCNPGSQVSSSCDDGNPCTMSDHCTSTAAASCTGTAKACDDANACTADSCVSGTCVNTTLTTACDDGNPCTMGDVCGALPSGMVGCKGTLWSGASCSDGNPCTLVDVCNANGGCTGSGAKDCSDGDACTVDSCDAALNCTHVTDSCNDTNPCTFDSCIAASGCKHDATVNEGAALCTLTGGSPGVCHAGGCVACVANAQCPVPSAPCKHWACSASYKCEEVLESQVACNDGNSCTFFDSCQNGICAGVGCDDSNPCTVDACVNAACTHVADSCNDNNLCTDDSCVAGVGCTHPPTNCNNDQNVCTLETCSPLTGCAANGNATTGTTCTVGTTPGDGYCNAGSCFACIVGSNLGCAASTQCTQIQCVVDGNNLHGTCKSLFLVGNTCDDGSACTLNDSCSISGSCTSGTAQVCNDSNPCTVDSCIPATGCKYEFQLAAACNDGNPCTSGDQCIFATQQCAGTPQPGGSCNDGNACTTNDACVATNGSLTCVGTSTCNDNSVCTTDSCVPATGCTHVAINCADANDCTTDSCNAMTGCVNDANANACNDQDACTENDTCGNKSCHGTAKSCSDGNPCTGDVCTAGACSNPVLTCNDNNSCTTDFCNPQTGCVNAVTAGLEGVLTRNTTCELFGFSSAIDGDTMVVSGGAGANDSVYIYTRTNHVWSLQASLGTGCGAMAVALSGSTAIAQCSHTVVVWTRTGTTWNQQAVLAAGGGVISDNFANDVAISGDTIVVGANGHTPNLVNGAPGSGAVYVFVRSGTTWTQQALLKAASSDPGDRFGESVAIANNTLVVGAVYEDSNQTTITNGNTASTNNSTANSGAAYVYTRSGTTWTQQAFLKAPNPDVNDYFGGNVAISADTVVIGARGEDSNATGTGGNQADNSASGSGAAYVYTRADTSWSLQAYVKASNTDAGDNFGYSVDVNGDTLVIGADSEMSGSAFVNGDQVSHDASNTGAAYAWVRSGTVWTQRAYLKASPKAAGAFGRSVSVSGTSIAVGNGACSAPENEYVFVLGTVTCDDNNPCTDPAATGASCTCSQVNNTVACTTDGNTCTNDVCGGGACLHPATAGTCTDNKPCTDDACVNGSCISTHNNANTCTDDNPCTADTCVGGTCVSVNNNANACTDDNPCTLDWCSGGVCSHDVSADGTACDDGDLCTTGDSCMSGLCSNNTGTFDCGACSTCTGGQCVSDAPCCGDFCCLNPTDFCCLNPTDVCCTDPASCL